jgi:hypothetical protein
MAKQCVINVDLASVFDKPGQGRRFVTMLAWGDRVEVLETTDAHVRINTWRFDKQPDGSIVHVAVEAFIVPPKTARKRDGSKLKPADVVIPANENRVLKVNFVDVQQGDGAVIESPDGKIILVDGGDNQLFARYLAARFRNTTEAKP